MRIIKRTPINTLGKTNISYIRINDVYKVSMPKKIGAYVVTHTYDNVHVERYVGATVNIHNRMRSGHCNNKKIIYIDAFVTDDINLAQSLERILMTLIRPSTNSKKLYLSEKDKVLMNELLKTSKIKELIMDNKIKIGYRYLKFIIGDEIDNINHKHTELKCVNIEEEIHEMLKEKNKEFKEKNNYDLPLGIIIGKVCRKYLKDMDLI